MPTAPVYDTRQLKMMIRMFLKFLTHAGWVLMPLFRWERARKQLDVG